MDEEQADFRSQRSTTEQIRLLVGKRLEREKELSHIFIDFKKAFDRVWRVLKEYNDIDNRLNAVYT